MAHEIAQQALAAGGLTTMVLLALAGIVAAITKGN